MRRVLFSILATLPLLLISCQRTPVSVEARPCDDGDCLDGYICHPQQEACVPDFLVDCESSSVNAICAADILPGTSCPAPGTFVSCFEGVEECLGGCYTCGEDYTWGGCILDDCTLGFHASCGSCSDDCDPQIQNASSVCERKDDGFECSHGGICNPGYADGDADPTNGCECEITCGERCAGSDSCGDFCEDLCDPPDTCGGEAGFSEYCGCTPDCGNRCGGDDGCGGTCSSACLFPETCGGAGSPDVCGCPPDCENRCGGPDGCGGTCVDLCEYPASCSQGGIANICNWWWDCDYGTRLPIELQISTSSLPSGYAVSLVFDHASMVAGGRALADGSDLWVVYWDGSTWQTVPRVLDPLSDWGQATTTIWFAVQSAVAAQTSETNYYIYLGSTTAGAPSNDEQDVFYFADFFERANSSSLGRSWLAVQNTANTTSESILSGALSFDATLDASNRPYVEHLFAPIISGLWQWRFGPHWRREYNEDTYRIHYQLGDSTKMVIPPEDTSWANVGTGPALVWTDNDKADPDHIQELFYIDGPGVSDHPDSPIGVASSLSDVQLNFDMDLQKAIVRIYAGTYFDLLTPVTFDFSNTSVDQLRVLIARVNQDNFDEQALDYVLIRQRVLAEPALSIGALDQSGCNQE